MKILLTGGGTGGHITPLLAVAHRLKEQHPRATIIYVGERHAKFASMTAGQSDFDQQYTIFAGKFRRYYGESWTKRLLDVKVNLLNLRDLFYFAIGTVQSWRLLRRLRPDVIMLKGGFVGVPIGLAASFLHIPFITHDSDSVPGLANRLVGRWATWHAVALPAINYDYPPDRTVQVGVLLAAEYQEVSIAIQKDYKTELGLPRDAEVLFVTGGSLGAGSINKFIKRAAEQLLQKHPKLYIIHQVGMGNEGLYRGFKHERLTVAGLVKNMYRYSGSADVIVTRAGANTLAEFGAQSKACIVVPNPLLTGGHQSKNASILAKSGAVEVVEEGALHLLAPKIEELLGNATRRQELGQKLHDVTPLDATQKVADILVEVAGA